MDLVTRVEEDPEERVAEVAIDDRPGARRRSARRGSPRTTPRRPRSRARRAARRSRRSPSGSSAASSTTNPARQLSAPQIPNATVKRSPRSIAPVARAQQAERARAARRSASGGTRAACRSSRAGGRPPARSSRVASPSSSAARRCDVWQAACSRTASWSTSLIDPQAVGGVDEQVGRVLDGPGLADERAAARRRGTTGASIVRGRAYVFQPTTPTRVPAAIPSSPRGSRPSGRDRSRGWLGRLRSWNRWRRIGSGAAPAIPQHSLPTRIAGSPVRADDEDRLLEPRVEAGQEGEVGAVLAVGVDDEVVVAAFARAGAEPLQPSGVGRGRDLGRGLGGPKSGSGTSARRAGGVVIASPRVRPRLRSGSTARPPVRRAR